MTAFDSARVEPVVSPEAGARLERFSALLLERNRVVNVTAARTPDAVAEHIRDSLSVVPYLRGPFVDVGSGGGFPALPVAILTGFRGLLIESVVKKARLLEEMIAELALPLEVYAGRAEDAGRDARYRGAFAAATARAVASFPAVLELTIPLLAVGGVAVLQRGRLAPRERAAGNDAALVLGAEIAEEREVAAGEPDERRILVVRKVGATGPRFPRRAGVPAKRPLCLDGPGDV